MRTLRGTLRDAVQLTERAAATLGELDSQATMPEGPFLVGLTHTPHGDMPPWTVVCGDGRAVAGHVPSAAIAGEIAMALNTVEALAKAGKRS
jgi:hypothetical protein